MTALLLRTRTLSDMGALDSRLYTSHHAPTDTVSRLGPREARSHRLHVVGRSATEFASSESDEDEAEGVDWGACQYGVRMSPAHPWYRVCNNFCQW